MGGCLILETLVLFHFCERNDLGPLGVSGLSMGGHVSRIRFYNLKISLNDLFIDNFQMSLLRWLL